jgi:hypothetical protein
MSDGAHGCGPECEPWITATHCGVTNLDHVTGELLGVRCPSNICRDLVVPLVAGRIAPHTAPVSATYGRCPWTGIRVVDDRALFQGEVTELRLTDPCTSDDRQYPS